ncbi:MAG TPA: tRNA (N6-threonylcarbamoyladenosine(37)-N6)-methyltransferase TrmO [Thermoplasmata archaeon]|nr:tRNA (N6-threonylcarbamoyladenosine(37)-N6)-methyltransferase TrmO [Thermoplasmata archaeon]
MNGIRYEPIGVIRSPFREIRGTPIQPAAAEGIDGTVEVFPEYAGGLADLEGFSHVILIYDFHLVRGPANAGGPYPRPPLTVRPFMDDRSHGVFATRAPRRPNPIGISVVRLLGIDGNVLRVRDIDIVNGTPLLDLKPYVPDFDVRDADRIGWLEGNVRRLPTARDDGRFEG